jgi:hypothetical protein
MKSNGAIIYQGPSMLDGAPIVVIAIGFKAGSANRKTGNIMQTYILRDDVAPLDAIKTGGDVSICGDCVHRGVNGKNRTCYVNIGQGVTVVYKTYKAGKYPVWDGVAPNRIIRLGTYGDPAAVPADIWQAFLSNAVAHTGYTHQWRRPEFAWLSRYAMASADTVQDASAAHATGWRTFRVALPSHVKRIKTEAVCPASEEAGKKLTCSTCKACNGNFSGRKSSIVIQAHGGTAVMANVKRLDAVNALAI